MCGCTKSETKPKNSLQIEEAEEIQELKFSDKLKNLGGATKEFLQGATVTTTDEEQAERLEICRTCENLKRFSPLPVEADITLKDTCNKCGCVLRLKVKRKPKNQDDITSKWRCPELKW